MALVSDEHADAIVWGSGDGSSDQDDSAEDLDDLDNVDRLYTFQVAKTREEEENVTATAGFRVCNDDLFPSIAHRVSQIANERIVTAQVPEDPLVTPTMFSPRLIAGHGALGFMTVKYIPASNHSKSSSEEYQTFRLRNML